MTTVCQPLPTTTKCRYRYHLRGQLQGVGFRPFIHRLAHEFHLTGWIVNDSGGVTMELQGPRAALESFTTAWTGSLPPLARLASSECASLRIIARESTFTIRASHTQAGNADAAVTIDTALCADCRGELCNEGDRRHGHAFINCTNCGPRFSIVRDIPYDRPNTTMSGFRMCPRCTREYHDPGNRRFHAQPICCRECGPKLRLVSTDGKKISGVPIDQAVQLLVDGKIVAIKGIGGFHLAVRADRAEAVARLRVLKQRDSKPFALMVADLPAARRLAHLSSEAQAELVSPAAPILLACRTTQAELEIAPAVAPGTHLLGLMLPYTPLHHLLFHGLGERCNPLPAPALVMTSGNLADEPLAIDNADARARLGPLCDAFLMHDRPIERCVDDSVLRDRGEGHQPLAIRRSRGYVPAAWAIPRKFSDHPTGICLGGELKNTIALVRQHEVILSGHLGDLTHPLAYEYFQKAVADFTRLFHVQIEFIAHDLHPSYLSTHFARQLAAQHHVRLIPVQHHVAHAHGVLAEHGIDGPSLALVCDGAGYGPDGTSWGGELLYVNKCNWKRLASLRPMRLPGGDAAAADTRRSALALLHQAYGDSFDRLPIARKLFPEPDELGTLAHMIRSGLNSPWTTSTGRLFDGIAALLGLCSRNQHEAQAAMALEAAAYRAVQGRGRHEASTTGNGNSAWFGVEKAAGDQWYLDLAPFVRRVVETGTGPGDAAPMAAEFHRALAQGLVALADAVNHPRLPLAISGGTVCNQIFCAHLLAHAALHEREILVPKNYPPTDAGLALGQAVAVLHECRGG